MIVIVGFPLRARVCRALQIDAPGAVRDFFRSDAEPPELREAADKHPQHDKQRPGNKRDDGRKNRTVMHGKPPPVERPGEGASDRYGWQPRSLVEQFRKAALRAVAPGAAVPGVARKQR